LEIELGSCPILGLGKESPASISSLVGLYKEGGESSGAAAPKRTA